VKIDKTSNTLPASSAADGSARAAGKDRPAPASAQQKSGSTSVSLGSTATQLQSMENSMANAPVVDAAKVAEIKQAIAEGRFQVNTSVVADRLIATVRDLIDNQS